MPKKQAPRRVSVLQQHPRKKIPAKRLVPIARPILDAFNSPIVDLSITLVTDRQIGALHWEYMGLRGATDILTFEIPDAKGKVSMAELVISLDTAARQARERGLTLLEEVGMLVVHGLLHLAGLDDTTENAWQKMKWAELTWVTRLCERL